jgi:hypothetical protein
MALNDISDARVDASDVDAGGFQTELDTDAIKEHIANAHEIVANRLEGENIPESTLERVELHLARHSIRFIVQGERQVDSESDPVASRGYSGMFTEKELEATSPGQQAISLLPPDKKDLLLGVQEFDQFYAL